MAYASSKVNSSVQRFRLLSDENKLRIIKILFQGPSNVTHLAEKLELQQSLVSHHLRRLKDGGIVANYREGKEIYYHLIDGIKGKTLQETLEFDCCQIKLR